MDDLLRTLRRQAAAMIERGECEEAGRLLGEVRRILQTMERVKQGGAHEPMCEGRCHPISPGIAEIE